MRSQRGCVTAGRSALVSHWLPGSGAAIDDDDVGGDESQPVSQLCVFVTLTLLGKRITSGRCWLGASALGFAHLVVFFTHHAGCRAIAASRRLRNKSQFFNDSLVRSRSVYLMGVGNVTRAARIGGMAAHTNPSQRN